MTFTASNLRDQIIRATDASDGEYNIDAITEEILAEHGAVDIDSIDSGEFWAIVGKHAADQNTSDTATIDKEALDALRLAAKFVLDHADRIDQHNSLSMDILKMTAPSATYEVAQETQKDSIQQAKDLGAVLTALEAAGIDS